MLSMLTAVFLAGLSGK